VCLSFRVKVADAVEVKDKSKQLALALEATALDAPETLTSTIAG